MKNILLLILFTISSLSGFSQIDKDKLALEVNKVAEENTEKLKKYIWKLHAEISGEEDNKTTLISEFSYNDKGELEIIVVDGETNIEKKPGIRGKVQQNAIGKKIEYVSNAMQHALAYTYMTKGQLIDFFDKAAVTEKEGVVTAFGKDIYVKGDQLTILIDASSKYFLSKSFSSKMGESPINGEVKYETFKGYDINHISTTKLEMPSENLTVDGENKDYTIRVD